VFLVPVPGNDNGNNAVAKSFQAVFIRTSNFLLTPDINNWLPEWFASWNMGHQPQSGRNPALNDYQILVDIT